MAKKKKKSIWDNIVDYVTGQNNKPSQNKTTVGKNSNAIKMPTNNSITPPSKINISSDVFTPSAATKSKPLVKSNVLDWLERDAAKRRAATVKAVNNAPQTLLSGANAGADFVMGGIKKFAKGGVTTGRALTGGGFKTTSDKDLSNIVKKETDKYGKAFNAIGKGAVTVGKTAGNYLQTSPFDDNLEDRKLKNIIAKPTTDKEWEKIKKTVSEVAAVKNNYGNTLDDGWQLSDTADIYKANKTTKNDMRNNALQMVGSLGVGLTKGLTYTKGTVAHLTGNQQEEDRLFENAQYMDKLPIVYDKNGKDLAFNVTNDKQEYYLYDKKGKLVKIDPSNIDYSKEYYYSDKYGVPVKANLGKLYTDSLNGLQGNTANSSNLIAKAMTPIKEDPNSALTAVGQKMVQSVAQVATNAVLYSTGGALLSYGTILMQTFGTSTTQALDEGAGRQDAVVSGVISGIGEAGSEALFGGIGGIAGVGALDDVVIRGLTKKFKPGIIKVLAQQGIKAQGEGVEELISGFIQALGQKVTYKKDQDFGKLLKDQNLLESYLMAMATTALMGSPASITAIKNGTDVLTGLTDDQTQDVVNKLKIYNQGVKDKDILLNSKGKRAKKIGFFQAVDQYNEELNDFTEVGISTGVFYTETDDTGNLLFNPYVKNERARDYYNKNSALLLQLKDTAQNRAAIAYTVKLHTYSGVDVKIANTATLINEYGFTPKQLKNTAPSFVQQSIDAKNRELVINIDAKNWQTSVMGHESLHLLEGTKGYDDIMNTTMNFLKSQGTLKDEEAKVRATHKNIPETEYNMNEEIVANNIGDMINLSPEILVRLASKSPETFSKLARMISDKVKGRAATTPQAEFYINLASKFERAIAQRQKDYDNGINNNTGSPLKRKYVEVAITDKMFEDYDIRTAFNKASQKYDEVEFKVWENPNEADFDNLFEHQEFNMNMLRTGDGVFLDMQGVWKYQTPMNVDNLKEINSDMFDDDDLTVGDFIELPKLSKFFKDTFNSPVSFQFDGEYDNINLKEHEFDFITKNNPYNRWLTYTGKGGCVTPSNTIELNGNLEKGWIDIHETKRLSILNNKEIMVGTVSDYYGVNAYELQRRLDNYIYQNNMGEEAQKLEYLIKGIKEGRLVNLTQYILAHEFQHLILEESGIVESGSNPKYSYVTEEILQQRVMSYEALETLIKLKEEEFDTSEEAKRKGFRYYITQLGERTARYVALNLGNDSNMDLPPSAIASSENTYLGYNHIQALTSEGYTRQLTYYMPRAYNQNVQRVKFVHSKQIYYPREVDKKSFFKDEDNDEIFGRISKESTHMENYEDDYIDNYETNELDEYKTDLAELDIPVKKAKETKLPVKKKEQVKDIKPKKTVVKKEVKKTEPGILRHGGKEYFIVDETKKTEEVKKPVKKKTVKKKSVKVPVKKTKVKNIPMVEKEGADIHDPTPTGRPGDVSKKLDKTKKPTKAQKALMKKKGVKELSEEDKTRIEISTAARKKNKALEKKYYEEAIAITKTTEIKDAFWALTPAIDTMKRNIFKIFKDQVVAQQIYDNYFRSIIINEDRKVQYSNTIKHRLQKEKLNEAERQYAQMWGEAEYNPSSKFKDDRSVIDKFVKKHKHMDIEKSQRVAKIFREVYDEIWGALNTERDRLGLEPLSYIPGYFRHIVDPSYHTFGDRAARLLDWDRTSKFRVSSKASGLKSYTSTRFKNSTSKQRKTDETLYDLYKGMDNYLANTLDELFHTEDLMKLRAFERAMALRNIDDADTRKQIKTEYNNIMKTKHTAEYRDSKVTKLFDYENGNLTPHFLKSLHTYVDIFAHQGKGRQWFMKNTLGKGEMAYEIAHNAIKRFSLNILALNVGSALTQIIPISMVAARVSAIELEEGIREMVLNGLPGYNDGLTELAPFVRTRLTHLHQLDDSITDKATRAAMIAFTKLDDLTTNVVFRSLYAHHIRLGRNQADAIAHADEETESIMGGRTRGTKSNIFSESNPIIQFITQFGLEVYNLPKYMTTDFKRFAKEDYRFKQELKGNSPDKDKWLAAYIGMLIKMILGAWLVNQASDRVLGRDIVFSPIDIVYDVVGMANNEHIAAGDNYTRITERLAQEIPIIGGFLGGGRIPIASVVADGKKVAKAIGYLQSEDKSTRDAGAKILTYETVGKVGLYLALPMAGGAIRRAHDINKAQSQDIAGVYDDLGNLKFEVGDDAISAAKLYVSGTYGTKESNEYYDEGYQPIPKDKLGRLKKIGITATEYRKIQRDINSVDKEFEGNDNVNKSELKLNKIRDLKDMTNENKDYLVKMLLDKRKVAIKMEKYSTMSGLDEWDYYVDNKDSYNVFQTSGVDLDTFKAVVEYGSTITKNYKKSADKQNALYKYYKQQGFSDIGAKLAIKKKYPTTYESADKEIYNYLTNDNGSFFTFAERYGMASYLKLDLSRFN